MKFHGFACALIVAAILPDPKLTPGKPNPALTKDVLCSPDFRTGPYRNVSESEKKKVFARYNIPWMERSGYEVDHLISLELGGSNDIENLWPEAYHPEPGAHEKDKVENQLHREVCEDNISLEGAQKIISTDWLMEYQREMKHGANQ